jgi:hypothetical protein
MIMCRMRLVVPVTIFGLASVIALGQDGAQPEAVAGVQAATPDPYDYLPVVRDGEEPLSADVIGIIDKLVLHARRYHSGLEERLARAVSLPEPRELQFSKDWREQKLAKEPVLVRGAVLITTPGGQIDDTGKHYLTRVEPKDGLSIYYRREGYVYRDGAWARLAPSELPGAEPATPQAEP